MIGAAQLEGAGAAKDVDLVDPAKAIIADHTSDKICVDAIFGGTHPSAIILDAGCAIDREVEGIIALHALGTIILPCGGGDIERIVARAAVGPSPQLTTLPRFRVVSTPRPALFTVMVPALPSMLKVSGAESSS